MNCFMCGCTPEKACNHPDIGPCWWFNEEELLCSHCADPEMFLSVERPKGKDIIYPELTKNLLKKYFKVVGFGDSITIRTVSGKHHNAGKWVVEKPTGKSERFEKFIKALFPGAECISPATYCVDQDKLIIRIN